MINTIPVNAVPYALYADNVAPGAIPTVNNGTLTIELPDGTTKTFTANQSGDT